MVLFRCFGSGLDRILKVECNTLTGIQFTRNTLPFIRSSSQIVTAEEDISVKYRIKIRNTHSLTVESGLHIADIVSLSKSNCNSISVYNRPIVPDFTTPYLVFGICGGVIVGIFSAFSKVLLDLM